MYACFRAFAFYFFLIFIVRVVGRRPGKQITPFEFVLVFFMGGLALTAMVQDEASLTNAFIQVMTLAIAHFLVAQVRMRSSKIARLFDGTPLILLEKQTWRADTMKRMGMQDDDVMASARDLSVMRLDQIDQAVLERNGQISVTKLEEDE